MTLTNTKTNKQKIILFSSEHYNDVSYFNDNEEDNITYDDLCFMFQEDWNDFKQTLFQTIDNNIILQGTEGLWSGKHKAGFYGDIEEALNTALNNKDEFTVEYRVNSFTLDKELWLITKHHDGMNEYHIKLVTDEGQELVDKFYDCDSYHGNYTYEKIPHNLTEEQLHDILMQQPYSKEIILN